MSLILIAQSADKTSGYAFTLSFRERAINDDESSDLIYYYGAAAETRERCVFQLMPPLLVLQDSCFLFFVRCDFWFD